MEGRYIGVNLRKLIDIIQYTEKEQRPALYMSVNFEKYFDMLEMTVIEGASHYFDFGDYFTCLVKMLYKDFETCIIKNGTTSKWFKPIRGT